MSTITVTRAERHLILAELWRLCPSDRFADPLPFESHEEAEARIRQMQLAMAIRDALGWTDDDPRTSFEVPLACLPTARHAGGEPRRPRPDDRPRGTQRPRVRRRARPHRRAGCDGMSPLTIHDGGAMSPDDAAWAMIADAAETASKLPGVSKASAGELQALRVAALRCARQRRPRPNVSGSLRAC